MKKKIIVPVSFSAASNHAAAWAAELALSIYADLYLVHAVRPPAGSSELLMTNYVFEELHNIGKEELRKLQDKLVRETEGKLNILTHMETGPVEVVIQSFCDRNPPFVVVMGTSGGSVLAIHRLSYPLIIVPEKAHFRPIRKIVLSCDLDDLSGGILDARPFLKELQTSLGASYDLVNVTTEKEGQLGNEVFVTGYWKDRMQELFSGIHFVHVNKVKEGVLDYVEDHQADLVLVFPKKHGLLEFHISQARKIALDSPVPVMSVHG